MNQVGPYALIRELARGGMGVVYEGQHEETGRRLAIKLLRFDALVDVNPEERERFVREAHALAALNHPNVVRIHAAEVDGPRPYLVQDLLGGGSLQDRLRRGPLPVEEAVRITQGLARGLAHAHAAGILHRDLKPSNVVFDERGAPCLVDFGIAQRMENAERLTRTGELLGTPAYMAPEQARGERDLDARTDVYGLGALLYAMLCGEPPFPQHASLLVTLAAVTEQAPRPVSDLRAGVPPALERACLRALAKDPAQRFPSVEELARALEDTRPAFPWAMVAALTVALAALGVVALRPRTDERPAPAREAPPVKTQPVAVVPAPSPKPTPKQLRAATIHALQRGDGASALRFVYQGLADPRRQESRRDWVQLRSLAWLLTGKLSRVKGRDVSPRAVELERRRLAVTASIDKAGRLKRLEASREWLREVARLIHEAPAIRSVPHVAGVLRTRLLGTIARCILEAHGKLLLTLYWDMHKLLNLAESLETPDARLGVARAILIWQRYDEKPPPHERRAIETILSANISEAPRFASARLALRFLVRKPDRRQLGPGSLLDIDVASTAWLESRVLDQTHGILASQAWREATTLLGGAQATQGAERWRLAVRHARTRLALTMRRRTEPSRLISEQVHLVELLLAGGVVKEASDLLATMAGTGRRAGWLRQLQAECAILRKDWRKAADLLKGFELIRAGKARADPFSARAVAYARLGDAARAERELKLAASLEPWLSWREPKQTRAEIAGGGTRAVLISTLKKR